MYWLNKLREIKSSSGESYKSIAEKTGIPQTTVEKLFSGRTRDPKLNTISKIVSLLGYSVSDLLDTASPSAVINPEESSLLSEYRLLDASGKTHVKNVLQHEYNRIQAYIRSCAEKRWYPAIYYDFPVSAGTGQYLDNSTVTVAELDEEPPKGTDFILRIAGDSMEPQFHDGDYVYVRKSEYADIGEIAIFVCEGSVYMKKYTPEGLVSLNPKYKIIPGSENIKCLGRVLGTVKCKIRT